MIMYHGTKVQDLRQLEPFSTRGNAIKKPVICFTPQLFRRVVIHMGTPVQMGIVYGKR